MAGLTLQACLTAIRWRKWSQDLETQDGLVERRLVLDRRGALGLVEITILEAGRVDLKVGGDVIPKLEQQGVDPASAARSLSPRVEVMVHDAQDFKGERREEVWRSSGLHRLCGHHHGRFVGGIDQETLEIIEIGDGADAGHAGPGSD